MRKGKRKSLILESKKGNTVLDVIMFLIVLFVFGIVSFVGYIAFDEINTDFQAEADLSTESKAEIDELNTRYPSFMDAGFIIILVLLWGVVIVASFNIDSHPIFFIFSVVLLGFLLWVGAELSNVFIEISQEADFIAASNAFPMTTFVMNNLVLFLLAIGASSLLALYGKSRSSL